MTTKVSFVWYAVKFFKAESRLNQSVNNQGRASGTRRPFDTSILGCPCSCGKQTKSYTNSPLTIRDYNNCNFYYG